ncbi:hypothetical protein TIFTF001_002834 [Ficus carica]|uniref:Uncharacterized protein n=1 Tax=Ficus carica TaxID=3494 RepID=A0AA87ZPJ5_FICCA|nr:hypothetical protein TIFTF001_002834 [Ficus carica]
MATTMMTGRIWMRKGATMLRFGGQVELFYRDLVGVGGHDGEFLQFV